MFRSLRLPAFLLLAMLVLPLVASPLEGQLRREDESEATRRTEDSRRRGESAEEATRFLQTEFRAVPVDLVRVLSVAGYRDGEVTTAVAVALRGDLAEVSRVLRVERWSAVRAAQGLREAFPRVKGAELWGAMTREGYPPAELAEVLPVLFLGDALSAAEAMKEGGWTPQNTARQLRIQYGLDAAGVLEVMRDAGWSINERAQGVVSQFSFPHPDHLRALLNSSARTWENVPTAMTAAGMPNLPYSRDRYEITETRIGMSGLRVDDGVLHRPWGSVPDPSDGVVWVVGWNLDRPEVRFFLGGNEGQIRGFTKEGDRDRVELFFDRVGTSPQVLSIRTLYSSSNLPLGSGTIPPRGADVLDLADIAGFADGLTFALGDPQGSGRVELPGAPVQTFTIEPFDVAGTTLQVASIQSGPGTLSYSSALPGPFSHGVRITAALSGSGPGGQAFQGSFLEKIPCWVCAGYEVPQSACGPLDVACFAGHLGTTVTGFGAHCLNPANWERRDLARGPAVPFSGSIQGASLELDFALQPSPQGRFHVPLVLARFQGSVTLSGAPPEITGGMVQTWLEQVISSNLTAAVNLTPLPATLAGQLNTVGGLRGWDGHLAALAVTHPNRMRLDLGR